MAHPAAPVPDPADASTCWPDTAGRRVIFLLDASSRLEQRLLKQWIQERRPATAHTVTAITIPPSRRRRRGRLDPHLDDALATGDDPLLAPLRVAWFPGGDNCARAARLSDLLTFGDPRDPGAVRQAWVQRRHPERSRVVVGEPAPLSDLRRRWHDAGGSDVAQTTGLAEFVARQAGLALERAERRLRGTRYKVPRFVYEDILGRPVFRGGLARLAAQLGRSEDSVRRDAARYLREIAATHSPYVIDLTAHLIHLLYTRGYSEALHYDRGQLADIYALGQRSPLVFLPTHKSNLDHLVLQYVLHENGHPPNHTAGGINMNFFPIGPLVRRSGVFFIRRTFKDNPVYKFVLQQYIDYLIEKRFSLEWYLEGGRSRSGKLLPPRFGLFANVIDAYQRGKSEDVYLIPVSIAYDQIQDVGDYVAEQRGAAKETESFRWFLRMVRRLRHNYGDIHIRFGEPLSLGGFLGPPAPAESEPDERNLLVQKVAFEVAVRINRATPITPTSLVTLALLGHGDRAFSVPELVKALKNLVDYVRRRQLPATAELDLDTPEGVQRTLDTLVQSGIVSAFTEGLDSVYAIGPDQHLTAAYYRNASIHFFVTTSIAELALLYAAEVGAADARAAAFWEETLRLRDLLKFEFFFADKDEYRSELREEMAGHDPEWEAALSGGPDAIHALLRRCKPFSAHRVLRPFLEAYRVVGDALERHDPAQPIEESSFLATCLALGKQYRLQRRLRRTESVSKVLFATALRLARNRELLEPGAADLVDRRRAFAAEIRAVIKRIDTIDLLAASRLAGLIE